MQYAHRTEGTSGKGGYNSGTSSLIGALFSRTGVEERKKVIISFSQLMRWVVNIQMSKITKMDYLGGSFCKLCSEECLRCCTPEVDVWACAPTYAWVSSLAVAISATTEAGVDSHWDVVADVIYTHNCQNSFFVLFFRFTSAFTCWVFCIWRRKTIFRIFSAILSSFLLLKMLEFID